MYPFGLALTQFYAFTKLIRFVRDLRWFTTLFIKVIIFVNLFNLIINCNLLYLYLSFFNYWILKKLNLFLKTLIKEYQYLFFSHPLSIKDVYMHNKMKNIVLSSENYLNFTFLFYFLFYFFWGNFAHKNV